MVGVYQMTLKRGSLLRKVAFASSFTVANLNVNVNRPDTLL